MESTENILNGFPNHDGLVVGEHKSCLKSGTAEDRGLPEGHDQTEASLEKKTVTFIDDVHENKMDDTNSPNLETQSKYGACDGQGAPETNCSSNSSTACCPGSTTSDKAEVFSENQLSRKGSGANESTDCTASESLVTGESNVQSEGTAGEENPSKKEGGECLPTKIEKQVTFAEDVEVVVPEDSNKLAEEEAPPEPDHGESHDLCHVTLPSHCQEGLDSIVGLKEVCGSERPVEASQETSIDERAGGQTGTGSPEMTRAVEDAVLKLLASSETKPVKEETGDDSSDDVSALLTKDKAGQNREPSADGGRTLQDFLRNYDVTSELGWSEGPDHFHHDLDAKDLDNMGDDEEELRNLLGPDVDRGWAWVVLVLSYLGMTIYGTFAFSTGILQAEILEAIEPDIQKTAWVGATHLCIISLSGPFASVMRDYIGSRRTILVASLVICIGMVGASFSKTVAHLILTYGLITGVGMGMALNPIFVSSGYYFVRYRGIASGVVAAGSSTGMFVGGPIIRSLLDSYGLGGTYLIMGAIGLQLAVVGMVMRPSSMEQKREEGGRMVLEKNWKMDSIMLASASTLPSVGGLGNVLGASTFNILRDKDAQSETQKSQLLYGIPEDKVVNYHVPEVNVTSGDVQDTHSRLDWHWQSRQRLYSQCSYVSSIENVSTRGRLYSSYILRDIGRPLSRSSLSIRTDDRSPEGATCCQFNCSCLDAFRILKNPAFLLYMFSCFMWYFGEAAVFTYLPSYAISEGTPPIQAALLMTVMGAGSIVSRLITGFVAGDSSVGPELMHIGLLGLCGALTVTLPLYASSTSGQFVYSGLFGLYAGGLVSSINIIIIQLIGVDNIALGFGFISFSLGVGCLAGPVLAGVIVGTTGNYGHVYFFCGTLLLVGCLAGCPIVMFKPRPPDHDTLGYFRKRGSIRSGSQVVSDDGVRSLA